MTRAPGSPFQPHPSAYDPRGFAVGVLSNRHIEARGLKLRQWRWAYGPVTRQHPYQEHQALAGRFVSLDGTLDGYYPGDHAGCECSVEPVWSATSTGRAVGRATASLAGRNPVTRGLRGDFPQPPPIPSGFPR